jgi:hypothetical protein
VQSNTVKHIKVRSWCRATGKAVGIATGYVLDIRGIGFPFQQGKQIFLFSTAS